MAMRAGAMSLALVTFLVTGAQASWRYRTIADTMRDSNTPSAETKSLNATKFAFPFAGGRATLVLRAIPYGTDLSQVYLGIPGFFLCERPVAVQFDHGDIDYVDCTMPSDGSVDWIKLDIPVEKIRAAKTLVVEPMFYRDGGRQFTFDLRGLR